MILLTLFIVSVLTTGFCLGRAVIFPLQAKKIFITNGNTYSLKHKLLNKHVRWIQYFLCASLLSVVLVETIIQTSGGRWGPFWLLVIHLCLVACMLTLLTFTLIFNGRSYPKIHREIVYYYIALFLLTLVTGLWLLVHHPMLV